MIQGLRCRRGFAAAVHGSKVKHSESESAYDQLTANSSGHLVEWIYAAKKEGFDLNVEDAFGYTILDYVQLRRERVAKSMDNYDVEGYDKIIRDIKQKLNAQHSRKFMAAHSDEYFSDQDPQSGRTPINRTSLCLKAFTGDISGTIKGLRGRDINEVANTVTCIDGRPLIFAPFLFKFSFNKERRLWLESAVSYHSLKLNGRDKHGKTLLDYALEQMNENIKNKEKRSVSSGDLQKAIDASLEKVELITRLGGRRSSDL